MRILLLLLLASCGGDPADTTGSASLGAAHPPSLAVEVEVIPAPPLEVRTRLHQGAEVVVAVVEATSPAPCVAVATCGVLEELGADAWQVTIPLPHPGPCSVVVTATDRGASRSETIPIPTEPVEVRW